MVGIAMGIGLGTPGTFLRAFTAEKGIAGLRYFFLIYAIVAFIARIYTRQLSDQWGTRPTIVLGLGSLAISMVAYLTVTAEWTLMLPAVFAGIGHALLFPAAVSAANQAFPVEHRGLATTLILTMFDVGMLIGQPTIGWTVVFARSHGVNGYAAAFIGLAMFLAGVALAHAKLGARQKREPQLTPDPAEGCYLVTSKDL
jgi:MFS family permease